MDSQLHNDVFQPLPAQTNRIELPNNACSDLLVSVLCVVITEITCHIARWSTTELLNALPHVVLSLSWSLCTQFTSCTSNHKRDQSSTSPNLAICCAALEYCSTNSSSMAFSNTLDGQKVIRPLKKIIMIPGMELPQTHAPSLPLWSPPLAPKNKICRM